MERMDSKDQALAETHTKNPHPERVTDSLFSGGDPFFDRRDLLQVKYEMLRAVEKDKRAVTDAAETFGLSRTAFYQSREAFRRNGLAGLARDRPGPRSGHKLTKEIVAHLEALKKRSPGLTWGDLVREAEERFGLRIHVRSVMRALAPAEKKTRPRSPPTKS